MKRILVIDDAEFILESTSTLLQFEGYETFTAVDGVEGIEMAQKILPDLILCDISMPRLDGYAVLDSIRSTASTEQIPFIFLTAFTEKANMRTGMVKGADDFLVKPYTRDELVAAIDAQWNKHRRIERKVNEKVEQVSKNISMALPHEFRTVLNEVIGSSNVLKSSADNIKPSEIAEISDDILNSTKRLLKITENFLIYTQIEMLWNSPEKRKLLKNGKTPEPSIILADVLTQKAEKYNRVADLMLGDLVDEIPIIISQDYYFKIIDELADNAFRFSGNLTKVNVTSHAENGRFIIRISDSGRGMTKEQTENISALAQFNREVYEQQGIGLGLVISKKLVELHDGLFEIESEPGVGTKITFSLIIA